jgi:heat shock protein HslJ
MRRSWTPLALALALPLAACASAGGGEPAVLEGTTWRIVQVGGRDVEPTEEVDYSPHFRILSAEGRVHGATGCNRFSGPYQADGTHVAFGPIITSRMMCRDPALQDVEGSILEVLEAADGYRIQGRWLWLMVGGEPRMTLEVWR